MRRILFVLALSAAACDAEPVLTHFDEVDPSASACVEPDAAADEVLTVVLQGTCYSGSTDNMVPTCEIAVDGADITVTALYSYDLPDEMTADCQDVTATCSTASALPAGSYTMVYSGAQVDVEVPRADDGTTPVCTPQ